MAPQPAGISSARDAAANPTLLAGFTIAVISHRRRHRLADLLEHHGARTVSVQGVRAVPQPDPHTLRHATTTSLDTPLTDVIISSATGARAWLRTAPDPDRLRTALRTARLLAANPRTADALRADALHDILSTATGTADEIYRYLLTHQPHGRRVAAQLDTPDQTEHCQTLRLHGAHVTELPTYTTEPPNDVVGVRRVVELIGRRQLDAVAWIDPVATGHILRFATDHGRLPAVITQLGAHIPAVCRGPLAAAVLRNHHVQPATPPMPFDEETAALLARTVLNRTVHTTVGGHALEVRGHAALLDGKLYPIQQGPVDVLRALATRPGRVLSTTDIRHLVPGLTDADDHAIEMTVSRLRRAVPDLDLVQTVIKHGYRLAA
ncbi:uroporphyrinogen-III synthase [Dactylosporangium roseum]|uniref:Uroporphyrinogen-III synthase n=1 Tax=Dactylosporangium roseum TaxID=47989 RepID=A0ABY5YXS7_9ACTN|nr:uroporphyrinogen-III synthase [Dactylosporangium roseum]UWZ34337.1 uroporphyrinogen-III synthase [Dactylosporangium roseum]